MRIRVKKFEINTLYLTIDDINENENFFLQEIMSGKGLIKYSTFFSYFNNLIDTKPDVSITLTDNFLVASGEEDYISVELDKELLNDEDFVGHLVKLLKKTYRRKIDGLKGKPNRKNKKRIFIPTNDFLSSVAKLIQRIINNPGKNNSDDIVELLMLAREYALNENEFAKLEIVRKFMEIKGRILPNSEDLVSQVESLERSVDSILDSRTKKFQMKPVADQSKK